MRVNISHHKARQEQFVLFDLDAQTYGISISHVFGVEKVLPLTHIPHAPPFIIGVSNLKGEVIPIMSLARRLDLDTEDGKHIVLIKSKGFTVGVTVDRIRQVITLGDIDESSEIIGKTNTPFVRGMGKVDERLIVLLNVDELLDADFS